MSQWYAQVEDGLRGHSLLKARLTVVFQPPGAHRRRH
jgi:hypothetical protein